MSRIDFRLPSLGADMESAIVTEWLKKPGETIHRGEAIAVVETAKGLIDIESYHDGTIAQIVIATGAKVPVGTVLARMDCETTEGVSELTPTATPAPGGATFAPPPAPAGAGAPGLPVAPTTPPTGAIAAPIAIPAAAGARRRPISPAARRRAQELGLDLSVLQLTGSAGVIHIEEVEKLAAATHGAGSPSRTAPPATAPTPEPRTAMRAVIGAAMARSKREIPHYYLAQAVDFAVARDWVSQYNSKAPVAERLIEGILLIKAVAMAAARIEGFNGYFREQRFEPSRAVHVGTAIALRGGGLVAPALLDADRKHVPTLMQEFSELVTRVRSGHMRSGELVAATITVTSLGEDGADFLYPIINPPQVAIVGSGAVTSRPWVVNGQVAVRPVLELTLAGDHRVTDGRAGSHFLRAIAELLATPEKL